MTSNQIAYWRVEEDKRSNKAKELETQRHNVTEEAISKFKNELTNLGISQDRIKNILTLQDQWAKYGNVSVNQLPDEVRQELYESLGLPVEGNEVGLQLDSDAQSIGNSIWDELKQLWKDSSRVISSLF